MPTPARINELLAAASAGMTATAKAVEAVQQDHKALSTLVADLIRKLALIEAEQRTRKEELFALLTLVRDGNNQPSLLARTIQLESGVRQLTTDGQPFIREKITTFDVQLKQLTSDLAKISDDVDELRKSIDTVGTAKVMSKGQIVTGVISAVVVAVLSLWQVVAMYWTSKSQ